MIVWHYATGTRWRDIQEAGEIPVADTFLIGNERPVAWFSSSSSWDASCTRDPWTLLQGIDIQHGPESVQIDAYDGVYRIGVDRDRSARVSFAHWRRLSGTTPRVADALAMLGRASGSGPVYWWVSFRPVPRDEWRLVETRLPDGTWVSWMPDALPLGTSGGR